MDKRVLCSITILGCILLYSFSIYRCDLDHKYKALRSIREQTFEQMSHLDPITNIQL